MKRKNKLISKKKLIVAINLFEQKIDEEIESINILSSNTYRINGSPYSGVLSGIEGGYIVDISKNSVEKSYPDMDFN